MAEKTFRTHGDAGAAPVAPGSAKGAAPRPDSAPGCERPGYLRVSLAPSSRQAFEAFLSASGSDQPRLLRKWVAAFVAGRDGELPVSEYGMPWPGASGESPSAYIQVLVDKADEAAFKARCRTLGVKFGTAIRAWIEAACHAAPARGRQPSARYDAKGGPASLFQARIPISVHGGFFALCESLGAHPARSAEAWMGCVAQASAREPRGRSQGFDLAASMSEPRRHMTLSMPSSTHQMARMALESEGRDITGSLTVWMRACVDAGALLELAGPGSAARRGRLKESVKARRSAPFEKAADVREAPQSDALDGDFDAAAPRALRSDFAKRCARDHTTPAKVLRSWLCAYAAGEEGILDKLGPMAQEPPEPLDVHVRAKMPRLVLEAAHLRAGERGKSLSRLVRGWMRARVAETAPSEGAGLLPASLSPAPGSRGAARGAPAGALAAVKVDLPQKLHDDWRRKLMCERSSMSKRGRAWIRAFVDGELERLPADPSLMRARAIPRIDALPRVVGIELPGELLARFRERCAEMALDMAKALRMWIEADAAVPARVRFAPGDD